MSGTTQIPAARRPYRRRSTRWFRPNRYDSVCSRCLQPIPAGVGEFRFDGYRWIARHPGGRCHTVAYTQYVSLDSPAWRARRGARLEYAHHQCEWRTLGVVRCKTTASLECHHRHYQHLGFEPLRDLIILCRAHHVIADRRRRAWGRWPLVGTPLRERPNPPKLRSPGFQSSSTGVPSMPPPSPPPPPPPVVPYTPADASKMDPPLAGPCPYCGADFLDHLGICRHCGKALPHPP